MYFCRMKRIYAIGLHLLFWAAVCSFFCTVSFLRPMSFHYWKEVFSALLVAGMIYANYFVLIPEFLLKKRHGLFWSIAIVLAVGTAAAELLLVNSDVRIRCRWMTPEQMRIQYITSCLLLFLRNVSFFIFFLMLKLYHINAILLKKVEKLIIQEAYKLVVISQKNKPILIGFKDIAYFTCNDDRLFITMKIGKQIECYGTLSEIEELIPQEHCIRVNRQNLVMRDSIVRYNSSAIAVSVNGHERIFPYFSTKPTIVFESLKNWNPKLYTTEEFNDEEEIQENNITLPEDMKRLLKYLQENPEANSMQVASVFHCSIRTAQRKIAK